MERRYKRRKLNFNEVTETRTGRFKIKTESVVDRQSSSYNFNSLPDELLLKIFRFLSIAERWTVGRVCKRFYAISRDPDPTFWKKVYVYPETDNAWGSNLTVERSMELFQILPRNVTSLKICLDATYKEELNFSEFSEILLKVCPNLQELSIKNAIFIDAQSSRITHNLSKLLPKTITVLQLREIETTAQTYLQFDDYYTSKIEVFDIKYDSYFHFSPFFLLQMPNLRELRLSWRDSGFLDSIQCVIGQLNILDLAESFENLDIFQRVVNYGINLTTLYVCYTDLDDDDIKLLEPTTVAPRLQKLCLRGCHVTYKRINSLIRTRLSLQVVYVGGIGLKHDYRKFDYSRCNSIKVRLCDHIDEYGDFNQTLL